MCNQLLKDTDVPLNFQKDKLVFRLSYVDFDGKKIFKKIQLAKM